MYRKKKTLPFLLTSLLLHTTAFLILMKIVILPPESLTPPGFEITDIVKINRPAIKIEPPERKLEEEPQPPKTALSSPVSAPKAELSIDFQSTSNERRATVPDNSMKKVIESSIRTKPQPTTSARPKMSTVSTTKPNFHTSSISTFANSVHTDKARDEIGKLSGIYDASPSVFKGGRLQSRVRLEQGWLNTAYSGGGNAPRLVGVSNGRYRQMMVDLARGIEANANGRKVDVVFLIDATGSMMDNVRGIRAYTDAFVERLRRDKFDVALGVVTFSDGAEMPKAKGVTTDLGEFKNWLYHTEFTGGGDSAENGLEALMTALDGVEYRWRTQKFFIMASDGPFHDADYNGRSAYSLDQVISKLKEKSVQVDVLGLDYLPMKQLAWATGGEWRLIPGKGYLENIQMPLPSKIYSQLGILSSDYEPPMKPEDLCLTATDEILVTIEDDKTEWVTLTWKVLNPHGEKYLGDFFDKKVVKHNTDKIRFFPKIDISGFPGTYTFIYKIADSLGNKSVLRRTVDVK